MDLDQEFLKLFEVKHECPKCKGKGCDHCDGKGYHVEDEDDDPVGKNEEVEVDESTAEYAKSLEKIANDRALKMLSKSERGNLKKIAALLDKEKNEDVELDEMPNRAYKEKINTLLKKYSGKFKWSGEELYVTKEIEKDVKNIISKSKEDAPTIKVSSSPLREAVNLKQLKKQYNKNEDENRHTENYLLLAKAFGSKSEVKKVQDIMKRNEKQGHTSKSDMDWMYKNINPYYDKIRNEEYMKLEDTVKQVLVGKKEEPTVEEQKVKKEDTDKDEPGTQGDMKKYQAARAKVMKKFGVKSCSELEGDEKKACYAALDAAHVSDDEEEKGEKKEEVKTTFSKMFTHVKSLMQGK